MPRLVLHDPRVRHLPLLHTQPRDLARCAQDDQAEEPDDDGEAAEEVRHVAPRVDLGVLVLDGADAVEHEVSDDSEAGVGGLEDEGAGGMLAAGVPAANDENEAGGDAALEEALERAEHNELREVLGCGKGQHLRNQSCVSTYRSRCKER